MHMDTLPPPLPLVKTWHSLAEVHMELTAGGTMKHIHSITLLSQKSKYTEQDLSRV